jgi:oligoendopeptidase F
MSEGWDLSDLYAGSQDGRLLKDVAQADSEAAAFAQEYKGKITDKTSAEELLAAIRRYEAINQLAAKPLIYASLVMAADTRQGAFFQRIRSRHVALMQTLLFFELELLQLSQAALEKHMADPLLANYAHFLSRQAVLKPHRLSEAEEHLLQEKDLTGRGAWIRLFDQEFSSKKFTLTGSIKKGTYSEPEVLHLLNHPNNKVRQAAAKALTTGLAADSRRLAYIYNMIAADKAGDDRRRRFTYPEQARHLENEIDQATTTLLVDQVVACYGLVQEYYRFKQQVLGLKEFHEYDRYAPIASTQPHVSEAKAQELVLDAFTTFSPAFAQAAATFFEKKWIDVYPRAHKQGGAFCAYVTPDTHPYVLTNYNDSMEGAFTLAHELGHGVHAVLANKQTYLNFDWPLTVAEMASVFGEMLLFDRLKNSLPNTHETFALHAGMVDRIFSTVFRQISMFRFEQSFHQAARSRGEQSAEEINALWRSSQSELYGDSVALTPGYDVWWSYIPHFIHTPFYVYAYAVGELLTLALYAKYKREGQGFAETYMAMLALGGRKTPAQTLATVGINMHDGAFWQGGLDQIAQLIEETKKLAPASEGKEKRVNNQYKD